MSKTTKSIQIRVPNKVWELLSNEAAQLGESLGSYGAKAMYERYNRDKLNVRMDRMPTEYYKAALKDAQTLHSAKLSPKKGKDTA